MNELVTIAQMRTLEEAAVARGVSEESLMEKAGTGLAEMLSRRWPQGGRLVVFAGKGHNAGDAFVAARELAKTGTWTIEVRLAFPPEEMKPLARMKLEEMGELPIIPLEYPAHHGEMILLDAVLGTGAQGELKGPAKRACEIINHWREIFFSEVVAVDLPSGLGAAGAVVADGTVTFGFPKAILVADAATAFVGRLSVVPLDDLDPVAAGDFVITPTWVRQALPRKRNFDTHKGQSGRVGIVAGSLGCVGAARLSATAAVRAGAGLVTVYVPPEIYALVAAATTPEVMVRTFADLASAEADAWGVGPGLGAAVVPQIMDWIKSQTAPAVIDADALNWISQTGLCALETPSGKRVLTPHPGEMKRLLAQWRPELSAQSRAIQATEFARSFGVTLLLKGARSLIAERGNPLAYNSTGTPAMATGGMGDVLTGIIAALLGQGLEPYAAACLGSWVLGRAGELAEPHGLGSSFVLDYLHAAMHSAGKDAY